MDTGETNQGGANNQKMQGEKTGSVKSDKTHKDRTFKIKQEITKES